MDKKGAEASGCNAVPSKVGRRRNGWPLPRPSRSDPRVTRFRAVEGTPAFGKALPFAGRCRNEGLGRIMRTVGGSSPPFEESATEEGCSSSSNEEGNLHPRLPAAAGGERGGPSLGAARPVQSSVVVQRPSPQTVVGSRRRPQAASRSDGGIQGRAPLRACSAAGSVLEGLSRLAAFAVLLRQGKATAP